MKKKKAILYATDEGGIAVSRLERHIIAEGTWYLALDIKLLRKVGKCIFVMSEVSSTYLLCFRFLDIILN